MQHPPVPASPPDAIVYKISPRAAWAQARALGVYAGSPDDVRDGYIHLSTAAQVAATLERFYAGQSDLVLAAIAVATLGATLRWEPARGGALFPHVYGPLPMAAVIAETPLVLGDDGRHVLPEEIAQP